jgi:hypothetical protein
MAKIYTMLQTCEIKSYYNAVDDDLILFWLTPKIRNINTNL